MAKTFSFLMYFLTSGLSRGLIGQGIGPRAIAEKLGLSVKTVEAHRENIKAKLGLGSGNELIRYAMQYQMDQTARPQ